jgi:hypothetical protein
MSTRQQWIAQILAMVKVVTTGAIIWKILHVKAWKAITTVTALVVIVTLTAKPTVMIKTVTITYS